MASYTYTADQDEEDRLIDWNSNTGEERDWDLSLVGDWDEFTRDPDGAGMPLLPIVQPRNHTDAHEVDDIDGTPADHDAKGNMTDDGAVTGGGLGGSRTFAWDFDNRLTTVTMPDGRVHTYTYDALGRRVSKRVDLGTSQGGGPYVETVFVCATHESGLGQVVAEYLKGQPATNPERHFVYGAYVDEPLAFLAPSAQSLAPKYLHRNRKYDIVGLTDASGGVLERYTYTPYGEVTILDPTALIVRTVSAVDNPYAYTGRRWEPKTGLYYFRARYYGPKLGRFLGRDPLGYVDGYSLYGGYFAWGMGVDSSGKRGDPVDQVYRKPDGELKEDVSIGELRSGLAESGANSEYARMAIREAAYGEPIPDTNPSKKACPCNQDWLDCFNKCIAKNDPVSLGMRLQAGVFYHPWPWLGRSKLGGTSRFTTTLSYISYKSRLPARNWLRTAGRLGARVTVTYGLALAVVEVACYAICADDPCAY